MEMKTTYPLLLIAAVCCFAPGMASVIRDGNDEQGPVEGLTCLQKALANNEKAADSVLAVVCAYMEAKDMPDKEELIKAIQNLEDVTGCTPEELFGTNKSPEQIAMDENAGLRNQIQAMALLLNQLGVPSFNIAVKCIMLDHNKATDTVTQASKGNAGQGNKRTARALGALLSPVTGLLGGAGGGGLLASVLGGHGQSGGLLGGLLGGLGGPLGGLLGGQGESGGLLEGLLGGKGAGGQKQDLLGGVLGILGGPSKSACGPMGSVGQGTQGIGGLTGVTDLLQGVLQVPQHLLGGLLGGRGGGGLGGLTGALGGLTGVLGG